ncbi:Beta-L-arabinobiosidase precursor [Planctomycetes bacterium MalM25]|nr:Beta-L-arabinobiosidase precursor [Planctomycetes bacterium MalM25]
MRLTTGGSVVLLGLLGLVAATAAVAGSAEVTGELKEWHKVTLTLNGPQASEDGEPNPFLDYRMQVTFRHPETGLTYSVPGYFAADGNAANTSATAGNKWRAHLSPDHAGEWTYRVSFREGSNVAISDDPEAGAPVAGVEGLGGSFVVAETDKIGRDMRAKGRLGYVGKHHLRFAGSGEYFLKAGADAPENFLAYRGFDGDFKADGHKDRLVKEWAAHVQDWREGDSVWQDEKGKGILGAINYLASQGMNVFSFITLNIEGDDRNVFPYTSYEVRDRIDCSRMDQWEVVFAHGTNQGMYLHFKTQEAENVNLLDNGEMGPQRKLYYRELIARFAHHLALNWNLGEEVGLGHKVSTKKKKAWAKYFWTHDPYQHHIVIHNGNHHYDLLGPGSDLTGFSLQTSQVDFRNVHNRTREYLRRSAEAGKPWVVACDEPGDAQHSLITDAEDPTHDNARMNALWGNLLAGGAGVEWYFGYKHPHSDLSCQDHRVRENMWKQSKIALDFFSDNDIPFWEMGNTNGLVDAKDSFCLSKSGQLYLVYLKKGGSASLDLSGVDGLFEILWFNPREGGSPEPGSVQAVLAGGKVQLGTPPRDTDRDWLAMVRPGDATRTYPPAVSVAAVKKLMLPQGSDTVSVELDGGVQRVSPSEDEVVTKWSLVSGSGDAEFQDASNAQTTVTLKGAGEYALRLTANEGGRESHTEIEVVVEPFRSTLSALEDFEFVVSGSLVPGYKDGARKAMAINAAQYRDRYAAAEAEYVGALGRYDLVLTTLTETDGESSYRLYVADKQIGEVRNPEARRDYEQVKHRFEGVTLRPGDKVRVEFNSASNGKVPEGDGFAYSRGRWRTVEFVEAGNAR